MARTRSLQLREAARLTELLKNAAGPVRQATSDTFSTGCPALDAALPAGGLPRGSLVEWLADGPGSGATLFAVAAARQAQQKGGAVVIVDRDQAFYPPAAAVWRLDLASIILIHPRTEADHHWALDQALRCEHVAAVISWPRRLDGRTFRRLQLAAETSGAVGLLVRPIEAQREPSWAHMRWLVTPRPTPQTVTSERWQFTVQLLKVRGGAALSHDPTEDRTELLVEVDPASGEIHETRARHLVAQLAHPAARPGQA